MTRKGSTAMQIGYLGLGKMGLAMVQRLVEKGHDVVAWNRSLEPRAVAASAGAIAVESVAEVVKRLSAPRVVWLMLPAGDATDEILSEVLKYLELGDTIIDGANAKYTDTQRRAEQLAKKKIHFLDAGVSGGPAGARHGACVMVGGEQATFQKLEPLFKDIAAPKAYRFFAGHGAGHFVKMVHNGIEYGMMQALAEGFAVLKKAPFELNLIEVAELYNQGSVIESRLVGWLASGYAERGLELAKITGQVAHSGEGQWTVEAAKELNVPIPIIEGSLQFRIDSQEKPSYTGKILSLLRHQFGGHKAEK